MPETDTIQPMKSFHGRVSQIQLWGGRQVVRIACPSKMTPAPGKYTLAWAEGDEAAPLATSLFAAQIDPDGFLAAPGTPYTWNPGTRLHLRGPLGRGFSLPAATCRLVLAALDGEVARLLPLIQAALERQAAVALFVDGFVPQLPTSVEVAPLSGLSDAITWADFIAVDLARQELPNLVEILGREPLPCPGQALVVSEMPCGGIAECGVCSLKTRRGWKLACKDGPVFDLGDLLTAE
jgi:NAD(P)H-flavin reductase